MTRVLLVSILCGGCLDSLAPEVGPPLRLPCEDADSDPMIATSYARDVRPIMTRDLGGCFGCHTRTGATPIGIVIGGLDLSTRTSLLAGGVTGRAMTVVPGQPCASVLLAKLGAAPPFGARMPLDSRPLSSEDIQTIADWIAEGADDN
jgi:Planctomycete cytochrome C